MGTEILKSFGTLQSELEQARSSLKGVDDNIRRLIGRDPSELPPRPGLKRAPSQQQNGEKVRPPRLNRNRTFNHENNEPPVKRRAGAVSVFKRLSDRPVHYEEDVHQQRQMISKVIVTPKELPSRQDALAAQSKDEQSKARNRRMFGALLGTLQKFQQEETKLKQKEDKRAKLEKKIEEHEIKEKEEIKKERQELFFNRKKKQAEIKMIELKMLRMKEYAAWEERQKPRMCFIRTKTKPHIYYLPRKMNEASKTQLEACKSDIERMIDKKRQEVFGELQHIEERMKKNFDVRTATKDGAEDDEDNADNNEENADEDDEEDLADHQLDEIVIASVIVKREKSEPRIVPEKVVSTKNADATVAEEPAEEETTIETTENGEATTNPEDTSEKQQESQTESNVSKRVSLMEVEGDEYL